MQRGRQWPPLIGHVNTDSLKNVYRANRTPLVFSFTFLFSLDLLVKTVKLLPLALSFLLLNLNYAQAEELSEGLAPSRMVDELSRQFEAVAEVITPSIVTISTETKAKKGAPPKGLEPFGDFFGEDFFNHMIPGPQRGVGTGVVIDNEGNILTNNHVIGDADEVTVQFDKDKKLKAKVVGVDPRTDLAVIKIKSNSEGLKPARLGDSDALKIGEWVVAAGASFGLDNTITAGIVSAKGRSLTGGMQYEDFIQTDAAINPGNSGGPLVNLRGEVVGINTAIVSKSGGYMGIGFAIPINMARSVMNSLMTKGKVTRGWLGVGIQNLTDDLAQSFNYPSTEGALVGHVDSDGPAKAAGLKQGDIIIQIDGQKIKDVNQLRNFVATLKPGTEVDMAFIRDGRRNSQTLIVGEQPSQPGVAEGRESAEKNELGIGVEDLSPSIARRLKTKRSSGAVVNFVEPGSPAARSEIQPGDIIVSVNGTEIDNVAALGQALEKADIKKGIRVVIESQGMERFTFLRAEEE